MEEPDFNFKMTLDEYFQWDYERKDIECTKQIVQYTRHNGTNFLKGMLKEGTLKQIKYDQIMYLVNNPDAEPELNYMVSIKINGYRVTFVPI